MVLGTVVFIFAAYFMIVAYQRRSMQVDVEVLDQSRFTEQQIAEAKQKLKPVVTQARHLFVEADRLRIAQGLAAIGVTMYVQAMVEDAQHGRSATYDGAALMRKLQANSLLPPGILGVSDARSESEFGLYEIRVEPKRQILEVFAIGKPNAENGDTYLIQLNPSDVAQTIRIWRSSARPVTLPIGLYPHEFMTEGWVLEPLRDPQITAEVKQQVQAWIANGGK